LRAVLAPLEELVASAVRRRSDLLAELVRAQVDAALATLVDELVAAELERRNGGVRTSTSRGGGVPGRGRVRERPRS
jgi:hypothetical protein